MDLGEVALVPTQYAFGSKFVNFYFLVSRSYLRKIQAGKHHEQEDRVISSKISRSENRAKLYLTHKDHKKQAKKTRPIGTANSSNTRGFANCISDLLEAVVNCEEKSYEVISSEDLLHSAKGHNKEIEKIRRELEEKKIAKNECWLCRRW